MRANLLVGLIYGNAIGQGQEPPDGAAHNTPGQPFEMLVRSSLVTLRELHDIAELAAIG